MKKEVLYEMTPIETYKSGNKIIAYDLNELDSSELLILRVTNSSTEDVHDLGNELTGIIKRPFIIVTKDIEFCTLRKVSLFKRIWHFLSKRLKLT